MADFGTAKALAHVAGDGVAMAAVIEAEARDAREASHFAAERAHRAAMVEERRRAVALDLAVQSHPQRAGARDDGCYVGRAVVFERYLSGEPFDDHGRPEEPAVPGEDDDEPF